MRRTPFLIAGSMLAAACPGLAQPASSPASEGGAQAGAEVRTVLQRYCQGCHNERSAVGQQTGVTLDTLDPAQVAGDAEHWERVVRRLRNGSMPPAGRPRPDREDLRPRGGVAGGAARRRSRRGS